MQNLIPRQSSIISVKSDYLENWKLWRGPITIKFNIFCWISAHVSYLAMSAKGLRS